MTFYKMPDKVWPLNQSSPAAALSLCSLSVNYILVKQNIKNLILTVDDTLFHAKVSALTSHVKRTLSAQRSPAIHHSALARRVIRCRRRFLHTGPFILSTLRENINQAMVLNLQAGVWTVHLVLQVFYLKQTWRHTGHAVVSCANANGNGAKQFAVSNASLCIHHGSTVWLPLHAKHYLGNWFCKVH